MTPLARRLAARIRMTGPLTLADYMEACLLDPEHGYYATRDPFGRAGDFTTAPEISQLFGEMLGLALGQAWLDQGRPEGAVLAELGPGRGTLMADVRRVLRRALGWRPEVVLVEASPHLRGVQRQRLGDVTHLDSVAGLPQRPLFLLANEFFDALPIRQFERVAGGWAERLIGLDPKTGGLRLGLGTPLPMPREATLGEVWEVRDAAPPIMAELAGRIARHGGAAIVVDYGTWDGRGDSFQALRGHAPEDPLARPGEADLTSHVDFAPLAVAALEAGAAVSAPVGQGALLASLGIAERAARLAAAQPATIEAAVHRLTDPAQMGELFKALAVWPGAAPPPPGFTPLRRPDEGTLDAGDA
ncbi:class I SAM-dependent methyltransferase [Paracoccus sp. S-4012]|uniref:class I SAM-dependent methyltransferase n=1 Tax=Paracoccus sp. S-4012 TaxID=2665648 RepID=UPI001329B147|nr:class I SAM-dependent methyltransferase [Paracoccus sp. S-4012]